ncbi:MAG: right-handed parallel beta-helix repeat-containing protein [Chitinophagaceae bacterium]
MKRIVYFTLMPFLFLLMNGCKKLAEEKYDISKAVVQVSAPVSDAAPLCGSIKGTMVTGKTYTIDGSCGDITINRGDTLTIQPGVSIDVTGNAAIVVRGVLLSLGTAVNPIKIGPQRVVKMDAPGQNPSTDPAYSGRWKGILADTSCTLLSLKWTRLEFCGATAGTALGSLLGLTATDPTYAVYFQNANGSFIFEDSWIYGTTDDAIRVGTGKFAILRNTFEKCGITGGDVLNVKNGGVGDMAYNFFIGCATNALKASNKGVNTKLQTNVRIYNNTIVNCGYRQLKTGRGGCINFEEGSRGMAFNNLVVNCKFGLRVNNSVVADTASLFKNNYGNNFYWADSLSVASQIFPNGNTQAVTKPVATDIPNPFGYLPANYSYLPYNAAYDGNGAVQKINPQFSNYALPVTGGIKLRDICTSGNFRFTLQAASPCIGAGNSNFLPVNADDLETSKINATPGLVNRYTPIPQHALYGVTEFTKPGTDIGCYQYNGSGNQHFNN